jgi:hypothetical protein
VYHIFILKTGAAEGGVVKDNFPSLGGLRERLGMDRRNEIHKKLMSLNSPVNSDPNNTSAISINILSGFNTNL